MINIRQAKKEELQKVIEFYNSQKYHGGDTMDGSEFILIAEDGNEFVGAVRLLMEESTWVMRGMFIDDNYQKHGIGKNFLTLMDNEIGSKECYCICKDYLQNFVGRIGFKKITPADAPPHLFERYNKYMENRTFGEMIMTKR